MALLDSRIRPTQQASEIGSLRSTLLNSVFPTVSPVGPANSPASPVAPTAANRTRAQAAPQQSAASRAAQAVASKLAANPVPAKPTPVKSTRANSLLTESAGTINTRYVNSAAAQGYQNVTPPNILRGMVQGKEFNPMLSDNFRTNLFGAGFFPGRGPDKTRESFRNNVFVPTAAQAQVNLFAPPVPPSSAILQQPLAPQVGVPINTFPPRNPLLNFLFPR